MSIWLKNAPDEINISDAMKKKYHFMLVVSKKALLLLRI